MMELSDLYYKRLLLFFFFVFFTEYHSEKSYTINYVVLKPLLGEPGKLYFSYFGLLQRVIITSLVSSQANFTRFEPSQSNTLYVER